MYKFDFNLHSNGSQLENQSVTIGSVKTRPTQTKFLRSVEFSDINKFSGDLRKKI